MGQREVLDSYDGYYGHVQVGCYDIYDIEATVVVSESELCICARRGHDVDVLVFIYAASDGSCLWFYRA